MYLQVIKKTCADKSIEYSLCLGTALGAVRMHLGVTVVSDAGAFEVADKLSKTISGKTAETVVVQSPIYNVEESRIVEEKHE